MKTSQGLNHYLELYARWIIKWRYLLFLSIFGFGLLSISGLQLLTFNNHYRKFFSKKNPFLPAYESMERVYSKNDGVLIVLEANEGSVFTNGFLEIVREITETAWQMPYSCRVDSVSNFQHMLAEKDDLAIQNLVGNQRSYSTDQLKIIRQVATSEPLLVNRLINSLTDVTAINVAVRTPDNNPQAVSEIATFARNLRQAYQDKYPGLRIYLTGQAIMNATFPEISEQDMSTLVPIMFAIIIVLSWFFLRSISATIGLLLVIGMSTLTAIGLAGWIGISLSPVSAPVPVIILMLAVADSIHMLMTITRKIRMGESKQSALIKSIHTNFIPIVITSVTTIIGFLGLNFSDSPPFRDLGNITAIGIFAALIYSLSLLPALIAILPIKAKAGSLTKIHFLERLAGWIITIRSYLLWSTILITIGSIGLIPGLRLNDNFIDYVAKGVSFRDDSDFAINRLTEFYTMEFSLDSGKPGGITNPRYFQDVDDFVTWLHKQKEVLHVDALPSTIKRLNKAMHGNKDQWYSLPGSADKIAQYLLLYELSLPLGLDLNNQINVDKSATRVVITLKNLGTAIIQEMKARTETWLINNAPKSMQTEAASMTLMFTYIARSNAAGLPTGTLLSLGLISLTLIILFKSIRFGLISMLPNILPIIVTFGIWRIVDGEVGVAAATVATVTIGIIVDDTVHMLTKYKRALKDQGASPEKAISQVFSSVGMALFATTIILCCGFVFLSQSLFKMNFQLGVLTAITIIVALILDFLFLPPLLLTLEGKRTRKSLIKQVGSTSLEPPYGTV